MDKLSEYLKLNSRKASVLEVGGFRPTLDPTASHFGLTPLAKPEETWPCNDVGEPLQFICQLNVTQAPFVPEVLKDIWLITFFVDVPQRFIALGCPKDSWCVRAYASLEGLVPLVKPAFSLNERDQWLGKRGFEARWSEVLDHPLYDDDDRIAPPGFSEEDPPGFSEEDMDEINDKRAWEHIYRTKIGGYPSNLQHTVGWGDYRMNDEGGLTNPLAGKISFAFQIDSEAKVGLNWVDSGVVYVGRSSSGDLKNQWFVSCQFY